VVIIVTPSLNNLTGERNRDDTDTTLCIVSTLPPMAMGKRPRHAKQASMWVAVPDLPRSVAHPFYAQLNQIFDQHDFDGYVEGLCQRFYADNGRPGLPPGRYFRLLLIGYFRRPGCGARDCMACCRFVCAARVSRFGIARGAAGPFHHLPHASL
jgi:hypothetical protein